MYVALLKVQDLKQGVKKFIELHGQIEKVSGGGSSDPIFFWGPNHLIMNEKPTLYVFIVHENA